MSVLDTGSSINDLEKGPPHETHHQRQDEARNTIASTYHSNVVKLKLLHQPWLEGLHQFMDPNAKGFTLNPESRLHRFDIKVLHFSSSAEPVSFSRCHTASDFEVAIRDGKDKMGTLILLKGISRAMIEALGTRFDLEPEFFANHLAGTENYWTGRQESPITHVPARSPSLGPDYIRKAPFYTAEFRRPYYIAGGKEKVFSLRVSKISTSRGVHSIYPYVPDVWFAEKISVYRQKGSKFGIILTDELLSEDPPASYIPEPVTFLNEATNNLGPSGRRYQVSTRRELVAWLQRLPPSQILSLFNDTEQLALRPVLKIVESNGIMFLAYARHIMIRIHCRNCDAQFPNSIPFFAEVTRSLHTYIHEQRRLLRYALRVAELRGGDDIAEQKKDFDFLAEDMDGALKELKETVKLLGADVSIREGRIVGWVSKFAALFLPVSLLATILSISGSYVRWIVLVGLSVPFVLILVYLMFFWKPVYFDSLRS